MMSKYLVFAILFGLSFGLVCNSSAIADQESQEPIAPASTATTSENEPEPDEPTDKADLAWMLVSSALVLFMTAPGLAMFYSGLVRKKNVIGVMMQCLFLMGLMSVIWALWGYSLAFGSGDAYHNQYIGNFDHVFLNGLTMKN
ncbi:MAG: ammonia channel protein, partial [Planctomycetota bacterium]